MITILHGDDIAASRLYYKSLQKKDTRAFEGEKITTNELKQALQTTSLFNEEIRISIENFFTKRKASKEMDAIIAYLKTVQKEHDIVFWETKSLTPKSLTAFPQATVKISTLPKSLFAFLENIVPNNGILLVKKFHDAKKTTEVELIFFMIIRHIRILLALTNPSTTEIDEIKRMSPWQRTKVQTQANKFSLMQLTHLHATLFAIEMKNKTGGLTTPLSQTIDFLLISI